MRIEWRELEAAQLAAPYTEVLYCVMNEKDARHAESVKQFIALPDNVKGALGYMICLLEVGTGESCSAYGQFLWEKMRKDAGTFKEIPRPVRFIGWAGKHNEIGPAYEINGWCHIRADSKIFYTDDDIRDDAWAAKDLAGDIEELSSGISDVHVDPIKKIRIWGKEDIQKSFWSISFRLDDKALKETFVNREPVKPEAGKAVFVLPKAGEFDCMLGEIIDWDMENAFVLARHNFCMK